MKNLAVLLVLLTVACQTAGPTPDPHSLEAIKQNKRFEYYKMCMRVNMPQYFDLIRIGFAVDHPSYECRKWAKELVR